MEKSNKRTRTDQQGTHFSEYEYDALDRLHKVKRDGADAASYEYDNNANRLSLVGPQFRDQAFQDACVSFHR
jgi:YD repeat-containing protein